MRVDPQERYTTDQFVRLGDCDDYELIDGRPEPFPNGARASRVAIRLGSMLLAAELRNLGWVFGSGAGFCCFSNRPGLARRPRLSFIHSARMVKKEIPEVDPIRIAPDVAIWVMTPTWMYDSLEAAITDFRSAGTRLIWVISPKTKSVWIRRADGSCAEVHESGELSGEDVIPGFTCKVAELFI